MTTTTTTTTMMTTAIIALSSKILLTHVVQAQPEFDPPCTICAGGAPANSLLSVGSGSSGGLSCQVLDDSARYMPLDSDDCLDLQVLGYRYCECPTYPKDEYCSMCDWSEIEDGNDKFVNGIVNENRIVELLPHHTSLARNAGNDAGSSSTTRTTCGDLLFVRSDTLDSCFDVTRYAFDCGCPNSVNNTAAMIDNVPSSLAESSTQTTTSSSSCDICGGTSTEITEEFVDVNIEIDGWGSGTCFDVHQAGMSGNIDPMFCAIAQIIGPKFCGCGSAIEATNPEETAAVTVEEQDGQSSTATTENEKDKQGGDATGEQDADTTVSGGDDNDSGLFPGGVETESNSSSSSSNSEQETASSAAEQQQQPSSNTGNGDLFQNIPGVTDGGSSSSSTRSGIRITIMMTTTVLVAAVGSFLL